MRGSKRGFRSSAAAARTELSASAASAAACLSLLLAAAAPAQESGVARRDRQILDAIERAWMREGVEARHVDATIADGIATLTGTTPHLLARMRCVEVAGTVHGVRAVIDRIAANVPEVDDVTLQKRVVDALYYDLAANARRLDVTTVQGTVTISGPVSSHFEAQRVTEVARGVRGVARVVDRTRLDIDKSRSDLEIYADIVGLLRGSAWIDDERIDVDVSDAAVTLRGAVPNVDQRRRTIDAAWVAGVQAVDSRALRVETMDKGWPRRKKQLQPGPDAIRAAIELAHRQDPRVGGDIEVDVSGTTVTLRGVTAALRTKTAAEEDARHTIGVRRVRNHIRVRPQEPLADQRIESNVRDALERDPHVDSEAVLLRVRRGRCYLNGVVDSHFEAARAGELARNTSGVISIVNRLQHDHRRAATTAGEIEHDIRDDLRWDARISSDEIDVAVTPGLIVLSGTVPTWQERVLAGSIAAAVGGDRAVDNQLRVPDSTRRDL